MQQETMRAYTHSAACPACHQPTKSYRRIVNSEAGKFLTHHDIRLCANPECGQRIIPDSAIWQECADDWQPEPIDIKRVNLMDSYIPQANNNAKAKHKEKWRQQFEKKF